MTVCPFAAWKPVGNHGGRMGAHIGLVLHVQAGNGSLAGWFNNPSAKASSTFWVSKAGALEQYVDADVTAWAQGTGNGEYNSVETEGYPDEPLTPAAEATLARLYAWGATAYRWPLVLSETPGQPGFGWHGMGARAWGGHTGCPGDLRKNRRQAILTAAGGGQKPTPEPEPEPEESDMIPAPCSFILNGNQQAMWIDDGGHLVHAYAPPGKGWTKENLGGGWNPDSGLSVGAGAGGAPDRVFGVKADGKRAQCYWSGSQWVTQTVG